MLAGSALRKGAAVEAVTGQHDSWRIIWWRRCWTASTTTPSTFLLESSVLDRFNAEQLDEVLERDDSAEVLGRLAASGNLFLISLDGQRVWYRYHRLFGDVLRDRLR